jgi:hypothetical protein
MASAFVSSVHLLALTLEQAVADALEELPEAARA